METEYRVVPGFPAYRVGSDGSVWSRWKRRWVGRSVETTPEGLWKRMGHGMAAGYRRVSLYRSGEQCPYNIGVLVLTAFVGPCPDGMEICHGNGNRLDDRLENLRWGTRLENAADRVRHGTQVKGERHPIAKLTADNVQAIRSLRAQGWEYLPIAKQFGVSKSLIFNICTRKAWKHVA